MNTIISDVFVLRGSVSYVEALSDTRVLSDCSAILCCCRVLLRSNGRQPISVMSNRSALQLRAEGIGNASWNL